MDPRDAFPDMLLAAMICGIAVQMAIPLEQAMAASFAGALVGALLVGAYRVYVQG